MAGTFRTQYEQKKWDSLKAQEKAALTRVMSGQGKPQDFKALESLVAKYDALAGQIMKRVLRSIEDSVNKQLQEAKRGRQTEGREPLSEEETRQLMDQALDKAWSNQGPELVVIVEESIIKALREESQKNQTEFSRKLNEQIGPRQQFTLDDVVEYLTDPRVEAAKRRYFEEKLEEVQQNIDGIKDQLYALDDRVEKRAEVGALRAIRRYVSGESEQRAHPRVGRTPKEILNGQLATNQVHDQETTEAMDTMRKVEAIITEAVRNQDNTLEQIKRQLADLKESDSDRRRRVDRDADAYARRLNKDGTFGKRAKQAGGVGLLAGLGILGGKLLLSQLMGGRVWQELEKFFSSDNLRQFGRDFMEVLESVGKGIANYIANQFKDAQKKADEIADVKDNDPPEIRTAKLELAQAKAALSYQQEAETHPGAKDAAQRVVDERQKKLDDLQRLNQESLSGGKGKIGPPGGEFPDGPKSTIYPPGGAPPLAQELNPPPTNPIPAVTPRSNLLGTGSFGSDARLATASTTVNPVVRPTFTEPVTSGPTNAAAKTVSGGGSSGQAVGGAIPNIANLHYRPSIDGSMGMANVGMLFK